jgi:3-hydroxymyristoyl/3-hydroxydecanoyl-(acyl carrier protein) dehydratase
VRFLLVDRILSLEPGRSASGEKVIARDEEYFGDHFPGYPVVPGVLLIESMAQLAGRLIEASMRERGVEVLPVLGMVKEARFHRPVRPGDRLELVADLVSLRESAARVTAKGTVDGQVVAAAELMFVLLTFEAHAGQADQNAAPDLDREKLRAWSHQEWKRLTEQFTRDK